MKTFWVCSVPIHDLSDDELLQWIQNGRGLIVTPNPEILLEARKNSNYQIVLKNAALAAPDGVAVQYAVAALAGYTKLHRHPGIDILPILARVAEARGESLVFLGGYPSDYGKIRKYFAAITPRLHVECFNPGRLPDETRIIAETLCLQLQAIGPCVVAVALGQGKGRSQGKQEFIAEFVVKNIPNARIVIGVGGSMDVLSGRVGRAPLVFQRLGMEWFWRVIRHPWRAKRIFRAVIVFPLLIAWDTLVQKQFYRACKSVCSVIYARFCKSPL